MNAHNEKYIRDLFCSPNKAIRAKVTAIRLCNTDIIYLNVSINASTHILNRFNHGLNKDHHELKLHLMRGE